MQIEWQEGDWRDVTGAVEWLAVEWLVERAEFDRKERPYRDSQEYQELRASILDKGIQQPVELHVSDGEASLVEGCHRVAIAQQEGIERVPAVAFTLKPDDDEPTFAPPTELVAAAT